MQTATDRKLEAGEAWGQGYNGAEKPVDIPLFHLPDGNLQYFSNDMLPLFSGKEGLHVTQPSTALSTTSSPSTASKETKQARNQECKNDDVKMMRHHHSFAGKASTQSKKGVKQENSGAGLSKSTHGSGSDKLGQPAKMDQPAKKQPKTPMNFQDLMKMAEKKSEEVAGKEKSKLQVKDPLIGRRSISPKLRSSSPFEGAKTSRGSSPVGKSLLERTNSRLKRTHSMMERDATCVSKPVTETLHTNGRQQSDRVGHGKPGEGGMASYKSGSGIRHVKAPVGRVAGEKEVSGDRVKMVAGEAQCRAAKQSSVVERTRITSPALHQQRQKQKTNAVKPNSFYGQPASARLLQEGRFATRHGPPKYRSTWVDEMSDYMRQKVYEEEYYSSDEDEDLDDFVVSGDEEMEEGEEDVSSAIRQIFGYDRRR